MDKSMFDKYGIKQIGYYVKDLEASAAALRKMFGAGPFVDMGVNPLKSCKVRGVEQPVRLRNALGQLGDMQIELIEVESDCPDPYKEAGRYGLHHYCIWVDDIDAAVEQLKAEGMDVAMEIESGQGLKVFYIDMRERLGQYLELNTPLDQLADAIAAVHTSWQGEESLISMGQFMKMMGR